MDKQKKDPWKFKARVSSSNLHKLVSNLHRNHREFRNNENKKYLYNGNYKNVNAGFNNEFIKVIIDLITNQYSGVERNKILKR